MLGDSADSIRSTGLEQVPKAVKAMPQAGGASTLSPALNVLLSALLALSVLMSSFFIAAEAGHDCGGDHCTICQMLQVAASSLTQGGIASGAVAAVPHPVAAALVVSASGLALPATQTLQSLHVRLDI